MLLREWRFYWLLLIGLCGALRVAGQLSLPTVPVYSHYHSGNSDLPAEQIYKIHADANGYIWLATNRGLVRYNGREFRVVKTGRVEDFVSSCMAGPSQLWLFAYSGHTVGIDLNTQKTIRTDSLYGLSKLRDESRLLLVGMRRDSLLTLYGQSKRKVVRVRLDTRKSWLEAQSLGESAQEILDQYRLPQAWQQKLRPELEEIIRRNYYGLGIADSFITIGNRIFKTLPGKEAQLFFDGAEYGVNASIMGFACRDSDLYLGGVNEIGLCCIRNYFSGTPVKKVTERLLPAQSVTCMEQDYLGNIWVGTRDNGLFLFPASENATLSYDKEHSGLYSDKISYIGRFAGDVTVLGYGDATADFFVPQAKTPRRYVLPVKMDIREISHIEQTKTQWLMFTRTEAFRLALGKDGLPGAFMPLKLREVSMDVGYKSGRLSDNVFYYISSNTFVAVDSLGNVSRCSLAKMLIPKRTCVLPLSDTEFYVGTVRGCYRNATALPYLQDVQINAIDTVAGQLLWATNIGVYAVPLNAVSDSRRLKLVSAGSCNAVKHDDRYTYLHYGDELTIVDNLSLWPISRFSSRDYPRPFRLNDFYPDKEYLILAGNLGLFYIPRENLLPQAVQVKAHVLCSLNGYAPADTAYKCSYEKGLSAVFKLDVLDYRQSRRIITCRILKDGTELYSDVDLGADGMVTLRPEEPGTYQVLYELKSSYAIRPRVLSYWLVITPLWYQQAWFMPLLIMLACFTFAWGLVYIQNRRARRQQEKLEQKIYLHELEAQSLLGQLKPHFIFNILTPFQAYLIEGDKLKGLDYLDHFSGLMRSMLQSIRHRYTALGAEIAFIEQYLQVQQVRFQHCFIFSIRTSPDLDLETCFIPSLLLQPLVENAVEHGMIRNRTDGRIDIFFEGRQDTLIITVKDNGMGLPPGWDIKPDHALAIIRERIQLLKKAKGTGVFTLTNNNDNKGVTATIILAKDNLI